MQALYVILPVSSTITDTEPASSALSRLSHVVKAKWLFNAKWLVNARFLKLGKFRVEAEVK